MERHRTKSSSAKGTLRRDAKRLVSGAKRGEGSQNVPDDRPPKRILERLGRVGDKWAWLDKIMIDWGDGKLREKYVPGMPDGAFILPVLPNGDVLLVHQYRLFGGWRYEIPGGGIDAQESEEAAALRELEEEAGYAAKELRKILSYQPDPNLACTIHLFLGRRLVKTRRRLEPMEWELTTVQVTPTQLWAMVLDSTITDARTIIATLIAKELGLIKVRKEGLKKGHPF